MPQTTLMLNRYNVSELCRLLFNKVAHSMNWNYSSMGAFINEKRSRVSSSL